MTDKLTDEIKPCPFCGGDAFVNFDESGNTNLAHVMCSECWVSGPERDNGTEVLVWNTRAPDATHEALREALSECDRQIKEAARIRNTSTSPKRQQYGRGLAEAAKDIRARINELLGDTE